MDLYRKGAFTTQKNLAVVHGRGVQIVRNLVEARPTTPREPGSLLRLDARPQPLRPARVGRCGPGRLDRGPAPLRGRSIPARGQSVVRGRRAVRGDQSAPDGAAGRPHGRPRQARLDPDRILCHGRPARDRRVRGPSVRVVGPLYGLQSRDGYDMAPNTALRSSASSASSRRGGTPRCQWSGMVGS